MFVYIDAIIIDTPIIDPNVRLKIIDAKLINQRLERATLFIDYLNECVKHLQDQNAQAIWQAAANKVTKEISMIHKRRN